MSLRKFFSHPLTEFPFAASAGFSNNDQWSHANDAPWDRHNIVADHSAMHSYYTEALVIQFFPSLAKSVAATTTSTTSAALPSTPLDPLRERTRPAAASGSLVDVD